MRPITSSLTKYFLAILSGLLLTGSFPKTGMSFFAWVALIPLLCAVFNVKATESFRLGFIAGAIHYLTLTYWVAYTMMTYGHLPLYLCIPVLFLFASFLALYTAFFSALFTWIYGKSPLAGIVMIPILWVCLEYIRSFLFTGFPWEFLGASQFRQLHLIQISDIFGVYGISFLIALFNGAGFAAFLYAKGKKEQVTKSHAMGSIAVAALLFTAAWVYGDHRIGYMDSLMEKGKVKKVAVVQGNVDQAIKWKPAFRIKTTNKFITLSARAKKENPDLYVWPETATPFYFLHNRAMSKMVLDGIRENRGHYLFGSPSFVRKVGKVLYYNSAYLVGPGGVVIGKYDKAHLVPFGEYVPLKKFFPFLGKMVEQIGDFSAGEEGKTLTMGDCRLGILICYEGIFPYLSRAVVKNGAGILVNITNDAWYGQTSAPYQHFSMMVFRAVENRRWLVRSANTGISGFIDPVGRIKETSDLFQEAVLTAPLSVIKPSSIYTNYGDFFARACLVVFTITIAILRRKQNVTRA